MALDLCRACGAPILLDGPRCPSCGLPLAQFAEVSKPLLAATADDPFPAGFGAEAVAQEDTVDISTHLKASSETIIGYVTSVDPMQMRSIAATWAVVLSLLVIVASAVASLRIALFGFVLAAIIVILMMAALQRLTRGLAGRALPFVAAVSETVSLLSPRPTPIKQVSLSFQIRTSGGEEIAVVLRGIQQDASLAVGDRVAASGRFSADRREFRAVSVRDLRTRTTLASEPTARFVLNRVCLWLLPVAAIWAVYELYELVL